MSSYTNWADVFYKIPPYSWAYVGIALSLAASILGAGWYPLISIQGNIHHGSHVAGRCRQSPTHPLKEPCEVAAL